MFELVALCVCVCREREGREWAKHERQGSGWLVTLMHLCVHQLFSLEREKGKKERRREGKVLVGLVSATPLKRRRTHFQSDNISSDALGFVPV